MAQYGETPRWSLRHAQYRGNTVTMAIMKCQGFFHRMVFQSRDKRKLFRRTNPQCPGKFGSKDGQTAKEQSGGDPGRGLNGERTERKVPGH